MASYPGAIKNFLVLEDGVDKVIAAHPNDRAAEITAIETELGTDVAGSAADLKTRLAVGINDNGTIKNLLGAWVDKSASYGAQQAATDGFVVVYGVPSDSSCLATFYTDGSANPATVRGIMLNNSIIASSISCPVKKGDYWKVVISGSAWTSLAVYWIPLGT